MAAINFYLRDPKAQKETALVLYVSFNNHQTRIAAVDKIHPKFWDAKNQRAKQTKTFPGHAELNIKLANLSADCENLYRKYINDKKQEPQPETLKALIKTELLEKVEKTETGPLSLFQFIEQFIEESKNRTNDKTGKPLSVSIIGVYNRTLSILKEYAKRKKLKIDFHSITLDFYLDFKEYLIHELSFSTNTVGKHIKTLKTFLNEATERGINTKVDFKSKRFKVTSEPVDNIYLNQTELDTLFNLDLSENKKLERVRDLFLVGCWTGLRFSDFNSIGPEHIIHDKKGALIEIETLKTREKVVIPVHWTIEKIMARYSGITVNSLPPSISNVKMNEYLKELGKKAEFKEVQQVRITKKGKEVINNIPKHDLITTHTARRSFATNAYLTGVPSITIMAITGHKTEKAFLKYIKVTPREHAEKLREMWQKPVLKVVND